MDREDVPANLACIFSLPWRERVRVRGKNNRYPHLYPLPSRERK
jgi:hypothetical protein